MAQQKKPYVANQAPTVTGDAPTVADTTAQPVADVAAQDAAPVADATVVETTVQADTTVTTIEQPKLSAIEQLIADTNANGTADQIAIVTALADYVAKMRPGIPQDFNEGARRQVQLWSTIKNNIENVNMDFKDRWDTLLAFFAADDSGCFSHQYVYRFAEYIHLDPVSIEAFHNTLDLIMLTANPAGRAAGLKQVDLSRSTGVGITPEGKRNLVMYYTQQ